VLQAVLQFYHSPAGQADINRWLTAAQISPNAWSFAWQLIQPQKVSFFEDRLLSKITVMSSVFRNADITNWKIKYVVPLQNSVY